MSTNKQDRRGGKRNRRNNRKKSPYHPEKPVYERKDCVICNNSIDEQNSALPHPESMAACHFDCVLDYLSNKESIQEGEKIVYMGSGNFAVVDIQEYSKKQWVIKRRIKLETQEDDLKWQSEMRYILNC